MCTFPMVITGSVRRPYTIFIESVTQIQLKRPAVSQALCRGGVEDLLSLITHHEWRGDERKGKRGRRATATVAQLKQKRGSTQDLPHTHWPHTHTHTQSITHINTHYSLLWDLIAQWLKAFCCYEQEDTTWSDNFFHSWESSTFDWLERTREISFSWHMSHTHKHFQYQFCPEIQRN